MPRLLSVALTEDAVRERRKTVTRRLGWWEDKNGRRLLHPGDRLTLVRKSMGRKKDEPLVRITEVEVVDVRRERLDAITPAEVMREGFDLGTDEPDQWFISFFCEEMRCDPDTEVTRIEWRYLDGVEGVKDAADFCDSCGEPIAYGVTCYSVPTGGVWTGDDEDKGKPIVRIICAACYMESGADVGTEPVKAILERDLTS